MFKKALIIAAISSIASFSVTLLKKPIYLIPTLALVMKLAISLMLISADLVFMAAQHSMIHFSSQGHTSQLNQMT